MNLHRVSQLGTILGVWAHPDDETYLSAALMAAARDLGQRVVCVTATRGEHGTDDPVTWPPDRLAAVRERELDAALSVLGVDEHHWLGYEDGTLAGESASVGAARIAAIIEAVDPDTIVTFGPDGMTGHADHRTISAWTSTAWRAVAPHARLLHATKTADFADQFDSLHEQIPVFEPGFPLRTPASALAVQIVAESGLLDRKIDALRAQASQTAGLIEMIGPDLYREWVREEAFTEPRAIGQPRINHPARVRTAAG